eukprot:SAG22_NODE_982_length_6164_cov_32.072218_4_plen_221_part_00
MRSRSDRTLPPPPAGPGAAPTDAVRKPELLATGVAAHAADGGGAWHTLELTTIGTTATALLDTKPLFSAPQPIRGLDTGFAALGMNDWYAVEFDDFSAAKAGPDWSGQTSLCQNAAKVGAVLSARNCSTNGLPAVDEEWELVSCEALPLCCASTAFLSKTVPFLAVPQQQVSNWQLKHIPSGLCATATSAAIGAKLVLAECATLNTAEGSLQQFFNDYTR